MLRNRTLLTLIVAVSTVILIQQGGLWAQPEGKTLPDYGIVGSWVVIPRAPIARRHCQTRLRLPPTEQYYRSVLQTAARQGPGLVREIAPLPTPS